MEFICGFVAGAAVILILDFFLDRRIEAQRKRDLEERVEALKKRRTTLRPQEMVTR